MESDPLMPQLTAEIIGFTLSLLGCALFSFLETSVTALRLFKLKELADTSKRYQNLLQILEKRPQDVLSTILVANSLVNVTAAALITDIMEKTFSAFHLSSGLGFSLGIGIGTFLILLFGEIIPKNIAKARGEKLFRSTLWITNIIYYLLFPFVRLLSQFSNIFVRLFGGSPETEAVVSEHEIKFLISYINEKGLIETEKTEMLHRVFDMGKKQVKEIMIPIVDVIMIEANKSINDALDMFSKYQYSRLPVYTETKDNIIGMLYQKDIFSLMSKKEEKPLKELVRPILFAPESMRINQLLREFKQQRMHIAVVINEHGSITGLVTLEDVIEEIVGEIRDEYEGEATEKIIEIEPENWLADAGIDLDSLRELLKIEFEVEDVVTLGGFLTEKLQHLPQKGERLNYKSYVFQVQKASPKRVIQVLIFKDKSIETTSEKKSE